MGKILLLILAPLLLLALHQNKVDGLSLVAANYQGHEAPSYHLKRSLCNTFGGCGTKRSMSQPMNEGSFEKTGLEQLQQQQQPQQQVENSNIVKRDNNAVLIDEVLGDLIEYMQNNEKYRQGKYVLVVPKHPLYDSGNSPLAGLFASNHITSMDAGASDLQELQILKRLD